MKMKAKTLKQITNQVSRINSSLATKKMTKDEVARFRKVSQIGRRYELNAFCFLRGQLGPADLDEYGAITPVPCEIYTAN